MVFLTTEVCCSPGRRSSSSVRTLTWIFRQSCTECGGVSVFVFRFTRTDIICAGFDIWFRVQNPAARRPHFILQKVCTICPLLWKGHGTSWTSNVHINNNVILSQGYEIGGVINGLIWNEQLTYFSHWSTTFCSSMFSKGSSQSCVGLGTLCLFPNSV